MGFTRKFYRMRCALFAWLALLAAAGAAQTVPDPDIAQMPPPAPRSSEPARKLTPAEVATELTRGGYVIYFRHAATDFSQNDRQSKSFEDCANQRNLIDAGRAQARAIGTAIRKLHMPVARVLASPLCRTMETARLIFGAAEPVPEMRGAPLPPADPNRYTVLRKVFATPQPRGGNLAIVSHGNPFYGVAGPPYLAEGEGAVIRALGNDGFEVIARIRVDDWAAITSARRD
jgi:phosphohistidine phosphatase SixA